MTLCSKRTVSRSAQMCSHTPWQAVCVVRCHSFIERTTRAPAGRMWRILSSSLCHICRDLVSDTVLTLNDFNRTKTEIKKGRPACIHSKHALPSAFSAINASMAWHCKGECGGRAPRLLSHEGRGVEALKLIHLGVRCCELIVLQVAVSCSRTNRGPYRVSSLQKP